MSYCPELLASYSSCFSLLFATDDGFLNAVINHIQRKGDGALHDIRDGVKYLEAVAGQNKEVADLFLTFTLNTGEIQCTYIYKTIYLNMLLKSTKSFKRQKCYVIKESE